MTAVGSLALGLVVIVDQRGDVRIDAQMIDPPGPPLPPSGPPRGLNFSRCTEATPLPPRPALANSVTWSTNVDLPLVLLPTLIVPVELVNYEGRLADQGRPTRKTVDAGGCDLWSDRRDDVDHAATSAGAELDIAAVNANRCRRCRDRHRCPGGSGCPRWRTMISPALTSSTAEALDAEALGVGIAAVLVDAAPFL